jgi:hypothetical protein
MIRHRFACLVVLALSGTALAACPGPNPDDPTSSASGTGAGGAGGAGGDGGAGGMGGAGGGVGGGAGGTACGDFATVPQTECNLLAQDCKLASQSCRPLEDGTGTDCFSATGLKGVAEPCADNTECQKGLLCVDDICSPMCCIEREKEICGTARCNSLVGFGANYVRVCRFATVCTLFEQPSKCPQGEECHMEDYKIELALCSGPSPKQSNEGEACTYINDCKESLVCAAPGNVCRYSCTINGWQNKAVGAGGCPQGQKCLPVEGAVTYGICNP